MYHVVYRYTRPIGARLLPVIISNNYEKFKTVFFFFKITPERRSPIANLISIYHDSRFIPVTLLRYLLHILMFSDTSTGIR